MAGGLGTSSTKCTMIGARAGESNTSFNNNTYVGFSSAINNDEAENTFIGANTGSQLTNGLRTVLIGEGAGSSTGLTTTTDNILIGNSASCGNNLTGAMCIGNNASVVSDYTLILGNNHTKVGIGLSGVIGGPTTKLDIGSGATGVSGLRIRDLTSSFTPTFASTGKVLTVDANGEIVLTNDQGSLNSCLSTGNLNHLMKYTNASGTSACTSSIQEDGSENIMMWPTSYGLSPFPYIKLALRANQAPAGSTNFFGQTIYNQQSTPSNLVTNVGMEITTDGASYESVGMRIWPDNGGQKNTGISTIISGNSGSRNLGYYASVSNSSVENYGAHCITSGNSSTLNLSIFGEAYGGTGFAKGVRGYATNNPSENIGVEGETGGTLYSVNKGVYGHVDGSGASNFGVYGKAAYALNNYGVYGNASGTTACTTGTCTHAAGYFSGDVYASAAYFTSDKKLKKNINDFTNGLAILNLIQPKTFEFDTAQFPSMNLQGGIEYGVMAQDIDSILAGFVKNFREPEVKDTTGNIISAAVDFKAVNYVQFIPVLISGIKEQQGQLEAQQLQIDSLLSLINGNSPRLSSPVNHSQKIELSDKQGIILNQNDPNPFSESTTITYSIPATVIDAKIMFSDNKGIVIRSAKIENRGEGSLEVYASELSSGIYTYTLVCDGKTIESKKMMKTK